MKRTLLNKANWIRFVGVAIACFVILSFLAWLTKLDGVRSLLTSIPVEAILSLIGGACSLIFSVFLQRVKDKNDRLASKLAKIEENYGEFLKSLRLLEGRIDEIKLTMNAFEVLDLKDRVHEEDLKELRKEASELKADFADLRQRQAQGDRLSRFADAIALCLIQQERILGKLGQPQDLKSLTVRQEEP